MTFEMAASYHGDFKMKTMKQKKDQHYTTHKKIKAVNDSMLPKKYRMAKALCDEAEACGGCQLHTLTYEGQLFVKQQKIKQLFKAYGHIAPIIGMEEPYYYRNKVHAVLKRDKRGRLLSGMYAEGSHHVIPIRTCMIEDQRARAIICTIETLIRSFKYTIYDEDMRQGFLRHILIRTGHQSGEILVVIVTASRMFPSKKHFVEALLKAHPEITSIVQNINTQTDNMVLGTRDEVLYGKGYIIDQLCKLSFKISPQSFYQINAIQTEKLYHKAIELAALTGKECVIDAYCGIGTIGMIASTRAKEVIGVEVNRAAIKDAEVNKKLNHRENITFYHDDAEAFMLACASDGKKVDVVFMDPPRSGSTKPFLDALIRLAPSRIIYISCGPETLKRDLDYLTHHSHYSVEQIIPCDMFPATAHIEVIVKLSLAQ